MLIQMGSPFNISITVIDSGMPVTDDIVTGSIKDISSGKFFNGLFWSDEECTIIVPHKEDGIYELAFTPDKVSSFEINIRSEKYPVSRAEVIHSYEEGCEDALININNATFLNQDGTDSITTDASGTPLRGVSISCYDLNGEIIAVTQSNDLGEWSMLVRRGTYFFTFEKEGFISVSFERTVV